jgi:hypothetical protein
MVDKELLKFFTLSPSSGVPGAQSTMKVSIRAGDTDYNGYTESRIPLAVLQTALLAGRKKQRWPVGIEIEDTNSAIERVRIYDDRDCKGDLDTLKGLKVIPLTPTAFADESPPKWGFFFSYQGDCKEAKGVSLDVYVIVESAWREEREVVLELDDHDLIIGARRV